MEAKLFFVSGPIANEAFLLIGKYLVLSSYLDLYINSCFTTFIKDRTLMDAMEKEAFDFKCRRLKHYLFTFQQLKVFPQNINIEEELNFLEKKFQEIRKIRNFLAHSVVNDDLIISSRRYKGERNGIQSLTLDSLANSIDALDKTVREAQLFFQIVHKHLKELS